MSGRGFSKNNNKTKTSQYLVKIVSLDIMVQKRRPDLLAIKTREICEIYGTDFYIERQRVI